MGILRTDKISGLEKERRQNPNLVINGDFSDSSLAGWTAYNAVVSYDSGAGGRIKVDDSAGAGGWSNAAYVVNTEPGASYRFEVRASATDSDTQYVGYYQGTYDTAGTAPTVYSSEITTTPSVHYFDIIATGSTVTIMLIANNNGVVYFDDVSFRKTDGNPIGGSVHFGGTGKAVSFPAGNDFAYGTGDFTIEGWFYTTVIGTVSGAGYAGHIFFGQTVSGTNYLLFGIDGNGKLLYYSTSSGGGSDRFSSAPDGSVVLNQWQHIALCRSSGTTKAFVDGQEIISISDTFDFTNTDRNPTIGNYTHTLTTQPFNGYVSNFRILKGTALYTSDFTVPTHELEVIGDTVLLCCNNSDSAGAEATGKTATVSGSAPASTFSPGLTRDFTYGTEFRGVTTFDTQGYFVPPSGTTEQRGRGRGLIAGGYSGSSEVNNIEYVTIASSGNAQDFGDLTVARRDPAGCASATRGLVFAGGFPTNRNVIDYVEISSTSNAIDFGDTTENSAFLGAAVSNSTRGVFAGGIKTASPIRVNPEMQYVTIASKGNTAEFGELSVTRYAMQGAGSPTRGIFFGGAPAPAPAALTNTIDYITIAATGNALDFGDISVADRNTMVCSNSIRSVIAGGQEPSAHQYRIEYVTNASTGNSVDFGSLIISRSRGSAASSQTRGVIFAGYGPDQLNTIEYITFATTGNASDFGDTTQVIRDQAGFSDSHGGLS